MNFRPLSLTPDDAGEPPPPGSLDPSLSPSLRRNGQRVPSFELKFLLPESVAREVAARLAPLLVPDPHGDPALEGAYRTTTLYLDTPEWSVIRSVSGYRRTKYRARSYGADGLTFLERKIKVGDRVRKKRSPIQRTELELLGDGGLAADSPAAWFQRQAAGRNLGPKCLVSYERVAYCGALADSPVRLTFDRDVRGVPFCHWRLPRDAAACPPLLDIVICEFKFAWTVPQPFKRAIESLNLAPVRVSKYRLAMHAAGVPQEGTAADARVA